MADAKTTTVATEVRFVRLKLTIPGTKTSGFGYHTKGSKIPHYRLDLDTDVTHDQAKRIAEFVDGVVNE